MHLGILGNQSLSCYSSQNGLCEKGLFAVGLSLISQVVIGICAYLCSSVLVSLNDFGSSPNIRGL